MKTEYDFLIVGAGPTGITLAERLASIGKRIRIIDKRDHIGGNCYDFYNEAGVLVHKYGPHYFRAKSDAIVNYLSNFTDWIPHRYKVKAKIGSTLYSFPLNKKTFEQFFGRRLNSKKEVRNLVETIRDKSVIEPTNAEEQVVSKVGREIYEAFFKGYTEKQWGMKATELEPSVTARIPIRLDDNDDYITEGFQAMPKEGYTKMFGRMLAHKSIETRLRVKYENGLKRIAEKTIWTGPIDEYYDFKFGKLPYRSLEFVFVDFYGKEFVQEECQINYPSEDVPYTRIVEIKHTTHQKCPNTTLSIEFPNGEGEPYYPVPTASARKLYEKYLDESKREKDVYFVGRLARYKYINTDQAIEEALELFEEIKGT